MADALGVERDQLAVEQRNHVQALERRLQRGHALGPVFAAAGQQRDVVVVDARQHPVAVELDFVHPVVSGRCFVD